jgi:RNA polymerase sigma-70 factor (ECF subfamily)
MRQSNKRIEEIATLQTILPLKNKLFRYALRIVGNEMLAEDIVQEVFLKVWNKEEELKTIDNSEAWVMTVTRNLALDKLRRKKKYVEDINNHLSIADKTFTPEQTAESCDMMEIIHREIANLPEAQNQVIHLRDIEGYSYKEIAEITGMTEDKVKVYLHRARQKLRITLSQYYS